MKYLFFLALIFLLLHPKEQLQLSPHGSYHAALLRENLNANAKHWAAEANKSLQNPLTIALPYHERRLLENEHLQPITFGFSLRTDQVVKVELFPSANSRAELFVDIYLLKDNEKIPALIDSMASNEREITVSAPQDGRYLVRVQPTLGAVGLIDLVITSPFRYHFPVDIQSSNSVRSFFGAERDGGRRLHEGIDIFAPRGTPVVAAAEGYVTRVGETPRGGKQVWVRGDNRSFYYAHLDSTRVARGEKVTRGQVLGTVGNTGNAITTKPHLHFGIYKKWRGAIDPLPLVGNALEVSALTPSTLVESGIPTLHTYPDVTLAPRWMSVDAGKLNVRAGPSVQYPPTDSLSRYDLVRVDAISGGWLRITTGRGETGFVARRLTSLPSESTLHIDKTHMVASQPQKDAPIIGHFGAGQELSAFGQFGEFTLVRMPGGAYGWASTELHPFISSAN